MNPLLFLLSILLVATPLLAVTPTPEEQKQIQQTQDFIQIQQNKLTQEQERRRQEEIQKRIMPPIQIPSESTQITPAPTSSFQPTLPTFIIHTIQLKNVTVASKRTQKKWVNRYQNRPIDLNDINHLIRDITNWYIENGYLTSRAFLPPQNLASGNLTLHILEGRIQDIVLEKRDIKTEFGLMFTFPALRGQVLNIRRLEQGLDQLNRLQSNAATLELLPGTETGYTIVSIKNSVGQNAQSTRFQLTYDNNTQHEPGIYPHKVDVYQDNLLGLQDATYLNFSQDNGTEAQNSNTQYFNTSIPFGPISLAWSYSKFNSINRIQTSFQTINSARATITTGPELSFLIDRDSSTKTTLKTSLISRAETSFIEDVLSMAGTRTIATWKTSINKTWNTHLGFLSTDLAFYQGVNRFGATRDAANITDDQPHAQFNKIGVNISWNNTIHLWNRAYRLSTIIVGQSSNTALFSPDKLSIGDLYSVRANPIFPVQGERGGYMRNEISADFTQIATWKFLSDIASGTQIYLGLDAGGVDTLDSSLSYTQARLIGAAIGLRHYGPKWGWDLTYFRSVKQSGMTEKSPEKIFFELTCRI